MAVLKSGNRIKHPKKPDWGIGLVLNKEHQDKINVYFEFIGEKALIISLSNPIIIEGEEAKCPLFDLIESQQAHHSDIEPSMYNVYVIELDKNVLDHFDFRKANPNYKNNKPCVYVGLTSLPPEIRFANHQIGHKSSKYPREYGERLLYGFFKALNPMPYKIGISMEKGLAQHLRRIGYAVWQN